jgi:predicted nucleic acid-binding protein
MRVIVDTCVWSLAYSRRAPKDHPAVVELRRRVSEGDDILLPGIVFQELLQGARTNEQQEKLRQALAPFSWVTADESDHAVAADLHRACRARGVAASTIDALIATLAIRHKAVLLTVDADFSRLAGIVGLELIRLPA